MTVTKFESKTEKELIDELLNSGLDPKETSNFIKWFSGKNKVKPKQKLDPISFNSPLKGAYSASHYVRAAELDPELGPLLKKSGKSADLKEYIELNMRGGTVSQSEITRLTEQFIRKIPPPSGDLGRKWTKFTSWLFTLKGGGATLGFGLLVGVLLKWWTVEDVVEETKDRVVNDEKDKNKDKEEDKNKDNKKIIGYDVVGNPIYEK